MPHPGLVRKHTQQHCAIRKQPAMEILFLQGRDRNPLQKKKNSIYNNTGAFVQGSSEVRAEKLE